MKQSTDSKIDSNPEFKKTIQEPLQVPIFYLRDKQFFKKEGKLLRLVGKPLPVAKKLKSDGCKLIHIVDQDALSGQSNNLDVYSGLTYFINIEVECASADHVIKNLLMLKCRVVIDASAKNTEAIKSLALNALKEKKLLVAKISLGEETTSLNEFHDVFIEHADDASLSADNLSGKRILVRKSAFDKLSPRSKKLVWAVLLD